MAKPDGTNSTARDTPVVKATGLTPKEYLQMKRIEKARSLLLNSSHTITDISLEVGFNSVSKFIEAFKKIEGKLPSDFRHDNFQGIKNSVT